MNADRQRDAGQTILGNDYNIHLFVNERGWFMVIYLVSKVALANEVYQVSIRNRNAKC